MGGRGGRGDRPGLNATNRLLKPAATNQKTGSRYNRWGEQVDAGKKWQQTGNRKGLGWGGGGREAVGAEAKGGREE